MRRVLVATFAAAALTYTPPSMVAAQNTPAPRPDTTHRAKTDSLPLTPTRKVEFDAHEGTWLSLDVSPDGKTIVFELLGDLYTMPVTGGAATRIPPGPALDSQPPDPPHGKHPRFLSDRSSG